MLPFQREGRAVEQFRHERLRVLRIGKREAVRGFIEGNAEAQEWLGNMYHEGMGVVQDLVMAYVWMNVAVANGYPYSKPRDKVLERLTEPASCPEYSN